MNPALGVTRLSFNLSLGVRVCAIKPRLDALSCAVCRYPKDGQQKDPSVRALE
jgi:hypothetical protein